VHQRLDDAVDPPDHHVDPAEHGPLERRELLLVALAHQPNFPVTYSRVR
jgi:hypothetical protein